MDYFSAIKKNEILPFETTWMDLESIMLSETSQTEKDMYSIISHVESLKKKKRLIDTENKVIGGCQIKGGGRHNELKVSKGTHFQQ